MAIELRIEDEGGKVNPNIASSKLLQALLQQLGVDGASGGLGWRAHRDWRSVAQGPTRPGAKAQAICRRRARLRPPGAPFESLDELGRAGHGTRSLARLRPHLTLYTKVEPDSPPGTQSSRPRWRPADRLAGTGGDAPQVVTVQLLRAGSVGR